MSAAQIEALCVAARKAIIQHINRVAGQQTRRMVEGWRRAS